MAGKGDAVNDGRTGHAEGAIRAWINESVVASTRLSPSMSIEQLRRQTGHLRGASGEVGPAAVIASPCNNDLAVRVEGEGLDRVL